jgi:predicted ATPase
MWVLDEEINSVARRVPESLQQLIERQLEQISREDVQVLEAASVAGITFAAAAAAAAVSHPNPEEEVETRCDRLARQQLFIERQDLSIWPDGTVSACYTFTHPLYQDVIYHRIPAGRCARFHQQIGVRLEVGYGDRSPEIAAELAEHFLRGQDARRAVSYLQYAGENAQRRAAG